MSTRSETFGRLLRGAINSIAAYEGKAAPAIEAELGEQLGLAGSAIQRYKAGHLPPDPRAAQVLAEAAVRRGFLSRAWLLRFLQAARHPEPARLADLLCPAEPERPRPPRTYHNLPAPTYSQFIMRPGPYAEVLEGLGKRSAAVLIIGLGGSGKTSLAREVAGACLQGAPGAPPFDAAIWVSDRDQPGSVTLALVLDEIARTLDYPGFTQLALDERRREVEQLLRRMRALVIVDNLETVADPALARWLLDTPEPSKALITTREYQRAFRRGGWPVELRGMRAEEALALAEERLRVLRVGQRSPERAQLDALIAAAGANPKAIELTLGLAKYERRPLGALVADLYEARGDLFDDLFARAWDLLDEPAQRALLALTLFPASAGEAALAAAADMPAAALGRALERLTDLALADVEQADLSSPARYALHPLARAFAAARLRDRPELGRAARERWLAWYIALAARATASWYETHTLAEIDPEAANLEAAIGWAAEVGRDAEVLALSAALGYFFYVRGGWAEQLRVNATRLESARRAGERVEEGLTLVNMLRIVTLQGRMGEAAALAAQVEQLLASVPLGEGQRCSLLHGLAVYALARGDVGVCQGLLREVLARTAAGDPYKHVRARNWLAESLLRQGDAAAAEPLLQESLGAALTLRYGRAATFAQLRLAQIAIARGARGQARAMLDDCLARAAAAQDRRDLALIYQTSAELHALSGDAAGARRDLAAAADLFERMGMLRERDAARPAQ